MKTKDEIIKEVTDVDVKPDMNILSDPQDLYDCMDKWADQEKQALKEKIIADVRQVCLLNDEFQGALEAIIRNAETLK